MTAGEERSAASTYRVAAWKPWLIVLAAAWIAFALSSHSENAISVAIGETIALVLLPIMTVLAGLMKL